MPELRKDPLTRRWVIISTDRSKRPVDFLIERPHVSPEADCPFCEGHEHDTRREIYAVRERSQRNAPGWKVRVVPSVNPVLRIEGNLSRRAHGIYDLMDGIGAHEVLIETPKHIGNLADLPAGQVQAVLSAVLQRISDLEKDPRLRYALWFKNYGATAGGGPYAHARSQIIATPITPKLVKEELFGSRRYFEDKERCLLCDMLAQEERAQERIVAQSRHMIAISPFASRFPFEVWIMPKRHNADFSRATMDEVADLALLFKQVLLKLKLILEDPPYNYLLHTAPFRHPGRVGHWKTLSEDYHWHIELIPRLARIAGFEWGTGFYINPTPPEESAKHLREAAASMESVSAEPAPPVAATPH